MGGKLETSVRCISEEYEFGHFYDAFPLIVNLFKKCTIFFSQADKYELLL